MDVDEKQAEQSMLIAGLPAWMVKSFWELFQVSKAGHSARVSPVVELVLKRKPISFDQFLTENTASFSEDRSIRVA
jgi:hypothetical protein